MPDPFSPFMAGTLKPIDLEFPIMGMREEEMAPLVAVATHLFMKRKIF